MSQQLAFANRQKTCKLDLRLLRKITRELLDVHLNAEGYDLSIAFVGSKKSAELNEQFLQHEGPTDIITFDYSEPDSPLRFYGELFICTEVAIEEAKRFNTTWQQELVRYLVHGILHLDGFDDKAAAKQKVMKREEDRLTKLLLKQFLN